VRLVGPYPFIAGGKIRVGLHRTNGGPTLVFFDEAASTLDEVSIKIPTADETVIRAYEDAVRAFNLKLTTALVNKDAA
jgi:hypothetical protein